MAFGQVACTNYPATYVENYLEVMTRPLQDEDMAAFMLEVIDGERRSFSHKRHWQALIAFAPTMREVWCGISVLWLGHLCWLSVWQCVAGTFSHALEPLAHVPTWKTGKSKGMPHRVLQHALGTTSSRCCMTTATRRA